ncbi:MAG TPA: hypothetical protein VHL53_21710 [Acidimicrobiia bacterium]|nr:hypothetical protein [Acidimicrobiia bacterium]
MQGFDLEMVWLEAGAHPDSPDGCLMEWVALLSGLPKTDRPRCINELVTSVAIHLNDTLDESSRQRLKEFIPRLLKARRGPADTRIGVRLAIWAASSIADSAPARYRSAQQEAVAAATGRLDGSVDEETCRRAASTAAELGAKVKNIALYVAADAADAACAEDPRGGTVNAVSGALQWVLRHGDPLTWFAGFLDAHAAAAALEAPAVPDSKDVVCSPV